MTTPTTNTRAPKLKTRLGLALVRMQQHAQQGDGCIDLDTPTLGRMLACGQRIAYSSMQNLQGRGYVARIHDAAIGTTWVLTTAGETVATMLEQQMAEAYADVPRPMRADAVLRDLPPVSKRPRAPKATTPAPDAAGDAPVAA